LFEDVGHPFPLSLRLKYCTEYPREGQLTAAFVLFLLLIQFHKQTQAVFYLTDGVVRNVHASIK